MKKYPKTFTLFTFKGIDLKISWSFQVFLVVLSVLSFIVALSNGFLVALVTALAVLFSVILAYCFVTVHEYGHALAAQHLGYKTRDIALYPMAGLASISGEWHKKPWDEFIITVWGPITNIVMGAIAFLLLSFCAEETLEYVICRFAFRINAALVIFNLLPVYPMDGGRILRAVLAGISRDWWFGTVWATRVSFLCGIVALPLGFYLNNPIAGMMIGFMGLMVAQAELSYLKNLKEIEELEEERLILFGNLLRTEANKFWPDDESRQKEFVETMLNFHKFLMRFVNWAVRSKVPVEHFEKSIAYLFSVMQDEQQNREMNAKAAVDENALFEEICEAAHEYQPVVSDAQPLEAQRESA